MANTTNHEVDELDAFMADNASSLKAETCSRIVAQLTKVKDEITQTSRLLSLVAPINLNKQKAQQVEP